MTASDLKVTGSFFLQKLLINNSVLLRSDVKWPWGEAVPQKMGHKTSGLAIAPSLVIISPPLEKGGLLTSLTILFFLLVRLWKRADF